MSPPQKPSGNFGGPMGQNPLNQQFTQQDDNNYSDDPYYSSTAGEAPSHPNTLPPTTSNFAGKQREDQLRQQVESMTESLSQTRQKIKESMGYMNQLRASGAPASEILSLIEKQKAMFSEADKMTNELKKAEEELKAQVESNNSQEKPMEQNFELLQKQKMLQEGEERLKMLESQPQYQDNVTSNQSSEKERRIAELMKRKEELLAKKQMISDAASALGPEMSQLSLSPQSEQQGQFMPQQLTEQPQQPQQSQQFHDYENYQSQPYHEDQQNFAPEQKEQQPPFNPPQESEVGIDQLVARSTQFQDPNSGVLYYQDNVTGKFFVVGENQQPVFFEC